MFWFLNETIPRVRAEEDMRSLVVAASSSTKEGIEKAVEEFKSEIGEVVKIDPIKGAVRDQQGLDEMKDLIKKGLF